MELKIKYRDYVADGAGGLVRVSGLLWREKGESRATAAKQYVAEALADEEGLSVMGVELVEKNGLLELRVLLRDENDTGEAVVTIGGE